MNSPCRNARDRGLTLVECLIALAIAGVVAGLAVPSFGAAMERRRLEGAAAQLETDFQLARSEALSRNHTLRLSFAETAAGACYVVHTGNAADCRCQPAGPAVCRAGAQALRSTGYAATGDVRMHSNVGSMVFAPDTGTVSPTGSVRLTGSGGHEVRVIVNIMGRVRACTPSPDLPGYKRC